MNRLQKFPTNLQLVLLTAVLVVFHPPGWGTQWIGFFAYIPFLIALERQLMNRQISLCRRAATGFMYAMVVAVPAAVWGMDWLTASLHVFGHLPLPIAYLLAGFGYGLEIATILFISMALPFLILRKANGWDLGVRLFWILLVDLLYPRLFQWSFGAITLFQFPLLEQGADLVGAWGLGFFVMGANLLLATFVKSRFFNIAIHKKATQVASITYLLLFAMLVSYGAHRQSVLASLATETVIPAEQPAQHRRFIDIVSVQPNFSLQRLASSPDLTFSDREFNLNALFTDSVRGLQTLPADSLNPRLLIWPESAFPWRFFQEPGINTLVSQFAREHQTAILLTSTEARSSPADGQKYWSFALLINPEGEILGRYDKIALMPFGEYIPGIRHFAWLERIITRTFPMISQFERGEHYRVFELQPNYPVSGTICFDATEPEISRTMAKDGARLIVNLSNLAWYGHSKATTHMEMSIRWRALENRVPIMMSSMNGETQLITAQGQNQGARLPLFTEGVWVETLSLQGYSSFYRDWARTLQWGVFCIFLACLLFGQIGGRIFSRDS